MAYSPIDSQLGQFLQIAFSEGVRSQISEDYRDWEMIKRHRVSDPNGRELRFLQQLSLGAAAIQYANPGVVSAFPDAQKMSVQECTAVFKEINGTIEIDYNTWERARKSPAKYAEPLALEIQSKTTASKRRLAADLYGDGTGVIAEANSEVSVAAGVAIIQLKTTAAALGHIGFCEFGDLLVAVQPNGSAQNHDQGANLYRVKSRSRKLDQVTLEAVDANGNVIDTVTATNLAAGDLFYRIGQQANSDIPNRPAFTADTDYGSVTNVIPGLLSLAADDGREVHGIKMSGPTAASSIDAAGDPLDVTQIQELMSNVKVNVGQSAYSWKQLVMAPEALDALIESRETDRRFNTVEDTTRGARKFVYQHGNDSLECVTSEYVQKKIAYALPEAKGGQKVLESYMTDFSPVTMGNAMSEFHLKPTSSGYQRAVTSFMQAMGTLVCKHPAAIAVLKNFS